MEAKKILLVEDEVSISEVYKLKLEKEWFSVLVADNWLTALTMISEFNPDLILLDIMMPSMNGFDSLTTIRNLAPSMKSCKIIMFSNLSSQSDIDKAMTAWADWYIVKADITPKELVQKLRIILNMDEKKSLICPHCHKDIYEI